jgi:hypothetical protein
MQLGWLRLQNRPLVASGEHLAKKTSSARKVMMIQTTATAKQ